jgi:LysM repeat protein
MKFVMSVLFLIIVAFSFSGCAKKAQVKADDSSTNTSVVEKSSGKNYVVKKGDSLWMIAGRKDVLGDSFQWPLLFRANRDQIQDPDFIEIRQDLSYKATYSNEEIEDAIKKAQATPPFVPRSKPRKVLPVKY